MKRFFTWFYYLSKRQLKNIFFLFILILIPLCALGLKEFSNSLEAAITMGIVDSDNTGLSYELLESLSETNGVVRFVTYQNTTDMSNDILNGKIQCGYEILKGFEEKLTKNHTNNLIEVYATPESPIAILSNELMFAKVFEKTGYYKFIEDIESSNVFSNITEDDYIALKKNYETNLTNGRTFNFNYSSTNGKYIASGNIDVLSYIKTPIRGIIAVFIFIAGLSGGFTFLKDKKNNVTNTMCIFDVTIPVLFAAISGTFAIFLAGINDSIIKETIAMISYSLLVVLFVLLLTKIIKNNVAYCSTIPVFSLGSLVCCPIFVNLATFLPVINLVKLLFMPTYYFLISDILLIS